jgi:nitrogen fixation/metabolism regulation signal transduction histidine kinase
MTLRTRIVGALIVAALLPMAVVLAVSLTQAGNRAREETAERVERARRQAAILVDKETSDLARDADHARDDLASDREALAAVVRGPETIAAPVAARLAERFGLEGVTILSESGVTLASAGSEAADGAAVLTERRRVRGEHEMLTLVATRSLGPAFAAGAGAVLGGEARIGPKGEPGCPTPAADVPIVEGTSLCVAVQGADARGLRMDLLRSFAGVAPIAFVAALLVGMVLAFRISSPIRALAERAEEIAAERARPMTLLPEKDETRRLTVAFDEMLDALSSSERQRLAAERAAAWEEIARRLAHEIKNPLSPIQLAVENLRRTRERAPGAFDKAFAEETATILEEVASLRTLVDEFAHFARLPKANAAPCDPRAIVAQALALFAARVDAMGAHVRIDDVEAPSSIRADADQIGRVLKNVVANALDAMEGVDTKTLAIVVRRDGVNCVFEVHDSGPGLDAEAQRRIFEPYFTTRGDSGGTGLGMAISHRIAVEHGGTIRADRAASGGARIALTIPIGGPPPDRA